MFNPTQIGMPQNTFNTQYQTQDQPRNQMLGNVLQRFGQSNPAQQYTQQANQNYAMPGGQGQAPYGFNAYAQGLNRSTGMQPMLPNPQLAQAQQY